MVAGSVRRKRMATKAMMPTRTKIPMRTSLPPERFGADLASSSSVSRGGCTPAAGVSVIGFHDPVQGGFGSRAIHEGLNDMIRGGSELLGGPAEAQAAAVQHR